MDDDHNGFVPVTHTQNRSFKISIDPEQMSASITIDPSCNYDKITKAEIVQVLKDCRVVHTEQDEDRIGRLIRRIRKCDVPKGEFVIVKADPPVHGQDGRIINLVAPKAIANEGILRADHYNRNELQLVNKGTKVLQLIHPTRARDGRSVFGDKVPARRGSTVKLILGPNVAASEDEQWAYATAPGRFTYTDGVASVEPDLHIKTNVSFQTSNVNDFEGDVVIRKDVFDLFEVTGKGNVEIIGSVEGARIDAGGSVKVARGILGKHKGYVSATENISCSFASSARLGAGGNVSIAKYAHNCTIEAGSKLLMPNGALSGGDSSCRQGAVVASLGSKSQTRTVVRIGIEQNLSSSLLALQEKLATFQKERIDLLKRLNVYAQKIPNLDRTEKADATKIGGRVKELEVLIKEKRPELEELTSCENSSSLAALEVRDHIYPGVEVCFAGAKTRFTQDLRGPVRIQLRCTSDRIQITVRNTVTGAEMVLPTEHYTPQAKSHDKADTAATRDSRADHYCTRTDLLHRYLHPK